MDAICVYDTESLWIRRTGTKEEPSAHNAMMAEENVRQIAADLNRRLDEISPLFQSVSA